MLVALRGDISGALAYDSLSGMVVRVFVAAAGRGRAAEDRIQPHFEQTQRYQVGGHRCLTQICQHYSLVCCSLLRPLCPHVKSLRYQSGLGCTKSAKVVCLLLGKRLF